VSTLGGEPRFLSGSTAAFWAGGDSVLLGPAFRPDSVFYVGVAGLDGIPRDSIRIAGTGQALSAISAVPGTGWILSLIVQRPRGLWQVVDRSGRIADRVINECACGGVGTADAVWLHRESDTPDHAGVRNAIDPATGKLATRQDTMALGLFTAFSLTSDGGTMVIDQGSYDHGVFALPFDSVLAGRFAEDRRIARASNQVLGSLSPDGARVLVRRAIPSVRGSVDYRFAVMPYDGGAESPVGPAGSVVRAAWSDSVHVAFASRAAAGNLELSEVDVRTGAVRNRLAIPDSGIRDFGALPTGWAWIPQSSDRFIVVEEGRRREFPKPAWLSGTAHLVVDGERRRLLYTAWSGAGADSVSLGVLSLDDGTHSAWNTRIGGAGRIALLDGSAVLFLVSEGRDSWSVHRVDGPNRVAPLGTIPRPVSSLTLSRDRRRVVANVRDYRADAWMSKVIR